MSINGHSVALNLSRIAPRKLNLRKRPWFTAPTAKFDFPLLIAVHPVKARGHATAANTGRTSHLTSALGRSYVNA